MKPGVISSDPKSWSVLSITTALEPEHSNVEPSYITIKSADEMYAQFS